MIKKERREERCSGRAAGAGDTGGGAIAALLADAELREADEFHVVRDLGALAARRQLERQ